MGSPSDRCLLSVSVPFRPLAVPSYFRGNRDRSASARGYLIKHTNPVNDGRGDSTVTCEPDLPVLRAPAPPEGEGEAGCRVADPARGGVAAPTHP